MGAISRMAASTYLFSVSPSADVIAVRVQIVPHLELSSGSRARIFFIYCWGRLHNHFPSLPF